MKSTTQTTCSKNQPIEAINMVYSANDTCPICGIYTPDGDVCANCKSTTFNKKPIKHAEGIYYKSTGSAFAIGKLELTPCTLQIDTNLIKLRHKELELEFELSPDKLANIDTIILNGYQFVKKKVD